MRFILVLLLVLALFTANAQKLSIADLLSLSDCPDTTCVGGFARSRGLCSSPFGRDKDGWVWASCESLDQANSKEWPAQMLGFFGYPISYYRNYTISTCDTAYAQILTDQINTLRFKMKENKFDGSYRFYRSSLYPQLSIEREEKRMTNSERTGVKTESLLFQFRVHVPKEPDYSHGNAPPR